MKLKKMLVTLASVVGVLLLGGAAAYAVSGTPRQAAATQYSTGSTATTATTPPTATTPTATTPPGATTPTTGTSTTPPTSTDDDDSGNAPGDDSGGSDDDGGNGNAESDGAGNEDAGDSGANGSSTPGAPGSTGSSAGRLPAAAQGTTAPVCTTMIFLGSPSKEFERAVLQGVRDSVSRAGGTFDSRAEIRQPVKVSELAERAGSAFPGLSSSTLERFSREVGRQLLQPGTLFTRVRDTFFADFTRLNGSPAGSPCSSVVLAYEDAADSSKKNKNLLAVYKGFIDGLKSTGLPVVGVEPKRDANDSSMPFFDRYDVPSTVNNIDSANGETAVSRLLRGAPAGHYGTGKNANALLPSVAPVSVGG